MTSELVPLPHPHMKKYLWLLVLIGISLVLLVLLRINGNPTLVITNSLAAPMRVAIVTDIGERYGPVEIAANGSAAVDIKGGDQQLWLVATYPDGLRWRATGCTSRQVSTCLRRSRHTAWQSPMHHRTDTLRFLPLAGRQGMCRPLVDKMKSTGVYKAPGNIPKL